MDPLLLWRHGIQRIDVCLLSLKSYLNFNNMKKKNLKSFVGMLWICFPNGCSRQGIMLWVPTHFMNLSIEYSQKRLYWASWWGNHYCSLHIVFFLLFLLALPTQPASISELQCPSSVNNTHRKLSVVLFLYVSLTKIQT